MATKNCAIYTRVSTDIQAEKEFSSCDAQEQKIRSFIESQEDWQISEVYSDGGYTGANIDRPALRKLMTDITMNKIDIVLVYKIDRLTRSPKDFYQLIESFEQAKIDFISITERFDTSTPAGRLLRNIMLTFSQFERELLSERVRDKMLERAKIGLFSGGVAPFGYMRANKKLIPHPENSKIIQSMFETYVETQSLAAVFRLMKEKGARTKHGNPFPKMKVIQLLSSPLYIGKVYHKGILYDGIHEPLISKDIFELAQKVDKTNVKKYKVYKQFLFGGLVRCQHCGTAMCPCFTNKWRNGQMKRYYYYRCTRITRYEWGHCPIKQVSAERLERYCLENLERIATDKSYLENLVFRLNNDVARPTGQRLEPSGIDPSIFQFSTEMLSGTLSFFTASLARAKGIQRNIFAKKCLKKIEYAPDQIKLSFWLQPDSPIEADCKINAPRSPIEKNAIIPKNENAAPFGNREFADFALVPCSSQHKTFCLVLPNPVHASKLLDLSDRRVEARK